MGLLTKYSKGLYYVGNANAAVKNNDFLLSLNKSQSRTMILYDTHTHKHTHIKTHKHKHTHHQTLNQTHKQTHIQKCLHCQYNLA